MKSVEITTAVASLAEYAHEAKQSTVIFTENGRPIAALISLENVDTETISLSGNDHFVALMERSRRRHRSEGGISTTDMRHAFRKS